MEGLLGFVQNILSSQPIMQAFAGAAAIIIVGALVLRGTKDRDPVQHAPAGGVAAGNVSDVPAMFAQGPQATLDTLREIKEHGRRLNEDVGKILDSAREIASQAKEQTAILRDIANEQEIANRSAGRSRNGDR